MTELQRAAENYARKHKAARDAYLELRKCKLTLDELETSHALANREAEEAMKELQQVAAKSVQPIPTGREFL